MVDRELAAGIVFMNARGLLHFDTHFRNILTDGHRLYFTDYGLALSSRFELAPPEADFLAHHRTDDQDNAATCLVNWLAVALYGHGPDAREAFVRACAKGVPPAGTSPVVAELLTRHGPVAAATGDFIRSFKPGS